MERCLISLVIRKMQIKTMRYHVTPTRMAILKNIVANTGREGNGTPLQYSCLENPMDRGTWWAEVHGVARVGHD